MSTVDVAERYRRLEAAMREWPTSKVMFAALGSWTRAGLKARESLDRKFVMIVIDGDLCLDRHVEEIAQRELDARLPVRSFGGN